LVHHAFGQQLVQAEDVFVGDGLGLFGALFDPAEASEVVEDFALGTLGVVGQRGAAFERADLGEREGVALDRGGGVGTALAAVLLEAGRPSDLDGGGGDLGLQVGNGLQFPQEAGGDGKLGSEGHGGVRQV
jgi:hypothetical protein